jgi:salicylate hydroxylase
MSGSDILVIGGGIGGLTAALAIQRAGGRVRVYERAPELAELGAGVSLGPNASRIYWHLGLGPELDRVGVRPHTMGGKHWRTGAIIHEWNGSRMFEETYGAPYVQIHRSDLHTALANAVRANDPQAIVLGHEIAALTQTDKDVTAHFANGVRATGLALIGCDGVRSIVRQALWGKEQPEYLGYMAWRGLVPAAAITAGEIRPQSSGVLGPDRFLLRYLVRSGDLVNYVAFARSSTWQEESWSVPTPTSEVQREFDGWNEEVQQLLSRTPGGICHKWGLFGREPLARWTKGRVTLLGDAAHPMLPFLGQGASMAIEDGMVIGRCLAVESDPVRGLARYETARYERTTAVTRWSHAEGLRFVGSFSEEKGTIAPETPGIDVFAYDAVNVAI